MKIIVRKSDGVAIYAVNAVLQVMGDCIVCDSIIIGDLGGASADVFDADVPGGFVGGKFRYVDGVWSESPDYVAAAVPEPPPVAPAT